MGKKRVFCLLVTFFLSLIFLSETWAAEKFPSREIQLVVGNPPGGFMAIAVQIISENLGKNLGVPVVVTYKPGGGGATGITFLTKSKPDGYTIGSISSADVVLLPATIPGVPFKYSEVDPLCKFFSSPNGVFCKGDSPWKTLEDLVADAKKRPGQITYGATTNSISHLLMEIFLKTAGIQMLHVPTQAAGETITRILGGNLDLGVVALAPLVGQLKAGAVRGLFLTTSERVGTFPQIPTLKELGYHAPVLNLYTGFYAPLGMPQPARETLTKALEKTIKDPSLKKKLEEVTLVLEYLPSEPFAKEIKEDYERIAQFVKTMGPKK
ncbi:MAG: Bug family tripartite tricarboxylate transporter substrate binding protein [Thermodesulfobacteriota bacterium]